jgi:hypothetical protein
MVEKVPNRHLMIQLNRRVMALDVRRRTFAFAVFEGPNNLLDFGARSFRTGANKVRVSPREKLAALFDDFDPSAVVIRAREADARNWKSTIGQALRRESIERRVPIRFVTRPTIIKAFSGNDRKYAIAVTLAERFPALGAKLPPKRKCWQSEDYRMSIFDAAALGVSYFGQFRKTG